MSSHKTEYRALYIRQALYIRNTVSIENRTSSQFLILLQTECKRLIGIAADRAPVSVQSRLKPETSSSAQSRLVQRSVATGSCQNNGFYSTTLSYKETHHCRTGNPAFTASFRIGRHSGTCYPRWNCRRLNSIACRSDSLAFSNVGSRFTLQSSVYTAGQPVCS